MYTPQNNIIIIDDNEDHIKLLSREFHDNGIGCRAFLYQSFYNVPLKGVNVAFFDININPSGGSSDKQIFASLAEALKQYIHIDNGPFALVFWTSNVSLIPEFKAYIEERHKDSVPVPFIIRSIDKHQFLEQVEGQSINAKLSELLNEDTIKLLFNFESKLIQASKSTIKQVYDIIPRTDPWGDNVNFNKDMEEVFSKIAISTLGFQHAKENPDKAVSEAFSQILLHQISKIENDKSWKRYLTTLETTDDGRKIKNPLKFQSQLNTVFHIDTAASTSETRGVVLQLSKDVRSVNRHFSKTYEEWLRSFITLKSTNNALLTTKISSAIKNSILIAVEISSACDYSQNKKRLHKYIYGILLPHEGNDIMEKCPECALRVGRFYLNNRDFDLILNLNYIFTAQPQDKRMKKPIFTLKKEITDFIGNRYANHGSRIGITSFEF